jgi:hypothetical protein
MGMNIVAVEDINKVVVRIVKKLMIITKIQVSYIVHIIIEMCSITKAFASP